MEKILSWIAAHGDPNRLSEADYLAGLELLKDTFRKCSVAQLQRKPYTVFKKRQLCAQLKWVVNRERQKQRAVSATADLKSAGTKRPSAPTLPDFTVPNTDPKSDPIDWKRLPDDLRIEWFRKGEFFTAAAAAFRRLSDANFDKDPLTLTPAQQETNAKLAFEILHNFAEVNKIHEAIDTYLENGRRTEPAEPKDTLINIESLTPPLISRELNKLRRKVNYHKNMLETAPEDKRSHHQAKLNRLQNIIGKILAHRERLKAEYLNAAATDSNQQELNLPE